MNMFKKLPTAKIAMLIAAAVVVFILFRPKKSKYTLTEFSYAPSGFMAAPGPQYSGVSEKEGCEMKVGTGLASSLLPREVASKEDFGQFAPQDVLAGQNFLEPRNQIGFPETTGGALRNANQQIRAEPPNPKSPFTWNNSTIVPDLMQRPLV
jgi:hypothetical protein